MGWEHGTEKVMTEEGDSSYLETAKREVERGQVSEELAQLDELVGVLFKDQELFEQRLEAVLQENYPSPTGPEVVDGANLVPLAAKLNNVNECLRRMHRRNVNIEERISL